MTGLDPISLIVGAVVSIVVSIIIYYITKILLFKNYVYWPPTYNQKSESTYIDTTEPKVFCDTLNTVILVKGSEPARNVELFMSTDFSQFTIAPDVPHETDKKRNCVVFGNLNKGLYEISVNHISLSSVGFLKLKGINSSNAICTKERLIPTKFHNSQRDSLFQWIAFLVPVATTILFYFIIKVDA